MRSLASIVTISNTVKMFEKDKIICAEMEENGYEVIIPSTYKVGDKMVFIQEGSILPETPTWEFLRKRCYTDIVKGFVIKPMVMGKKETEDGQAGERVKSWGLAVGLHECGLDNIQDLKTGQDITDLLGIRKYDVEELEGEITSKNKTPKIIKFLYKYKLLRWIAKIWKRCHTVKKHNFPEQYISKSDETSIQNIKLALQKYADSKVYTSVKLEGQSFTTAFEYNKGKVGNFYVCSRNTAYSKQNNTKFWTTAIRLDIEKKLRDYYKKTGRLLFLQGEQVGPDIQSNIYNLTNVQWYVYTIKDVAEDKQLSFEEMVNTCKELGLNTVPIIESNVTLKDIMCDISTAEKYAEESYWKPLNDEVCYNYKPKVNEKIWKDYLQNEGVVVRTMDYDKDHNIGISFKVKNIQYNEKGLKTISNICRSLI